MKSYLDKKVKDVCVYLKDGIIQFSELTATMPTATIPATYIDGKVIPKLKPPFAQPDEVMVTFVKYAEAEEDPDEAFFRRIEPQYRRIRREVVKKLYPRFYAKYIAGKEKDTN